MGREGVRTRDQNRRKAYEGAPDQIQPSASTPGHLCLHLFVYETHTIACISRVDHMPSQPGYRRYGSTRIPVGRDTLSGKPLDVVIALVCESLLVTRVDRLRDAVVRAKPPAPPAGATGAVVQPPP